MSKFNNVNGPSNIHNRSSKLYDISNKRISRAVGVIAFIVSETILNVESIRILLYNRLG